MADTLAEIYRDTLTESDFNSSGEATIVTTDSSTSHVIKSIQAEEVGTELLVAGKLQVNGFDIVGLTANSSGTEIIAPSSTVKVKASNIPFTYIDDRFYVQSTITNAIYSANAKLNGFPNITGLFDTSNTLSVSIDTNAEFRVVAPNLGPNNNFWFYRHDNNSSQISNLYNSSGTGIYTENSSYVPKWFDGYRYVYHIKSNNSDIRRLDTWSTTGATTDIYDGNFPGSVSTYARMFGIRDKWLFFWPNQTNKAYAFNLETNVIQNLVANGSENVDNAFNNLSHQFYAVETTTGYYIFVNDGNTIRYWPLWDGTTEFSSATKSSSTDVSLSGNSQTVYDAGGNGANKKITLGSRFYYINSNEKLAYFDFEGTPAFGAEASTAYPSPAGYPSNSWDVTHVTTTPTASEVSARSYSANIGLKLRISGVTTT